MYYGICKEVFLEITPYELRIAVTHYLAARSAFMYFITVKTKAFHQTQDIFFTSYRNLYWRVLSLFDRRGA